MTQSETDYLAYKTYIKLWSEENPIKTTKLQALLTVNGLLVAVLTLTGGFNVVHWPLFLAGSLMSAIWVLSIGRTCLFQKTWQIKAVELARKYPGDSRFQILNTDTAEATAPVWLRLFGAVSSKYYLLGAPVFFALIWAIGFIYIIASSGA